MYWEEDKPTEAFAVPDDVVDLAFDIVCRALPVDHAYALSQAVLAELPWLADEPGAGVHPIHVAESGNGWMRPENPHDLLHLSRRTKLLLRLPKARIDAARALGGKALDVHGHRLEIGKANVRPLVAIGTVFSRHVVIPGASDETAFIEQSVHALRALGIKPKKLLCGREVQIAVPGETLRARSVMLADLSLEESMQLQLRGLGPRRQLGCGLFIGHKDIDAVKQKTG